MVCLYKKIAFSSSRKLPIMILAQQSQSSFLITHLRRHFEHYLSLFTPWGIFLTVKWIRTWDILTCQKTTNDCNSEVFETLSDRNRISICRCTIRENQQKFILTISSVREFRPIAIARDYLFEFFNTLFDLYDNLFSSHHLY